MPALDELARARLDRLREEHLLRSLVRTDRDAPGRVERAGAELESFSCNDYLGLATDPRVIAAAREALERHGAGAGASRLVTGNHALYEPLERALAEFKGRERALVFGSGFLANAGAIPTLAGKGDLVLLDRLCHASMYNAARLSRAALERFEHNNLDDARRILERERAGHARCWILTESVFSMDGDLGPVDALGKLAQEFDAWLLVDDAHGLGFAPTGAADVVVGTLSKALGGVGGYVAASAAVIELLVQKAHTFIYTTGLPPASIAASSAALAILRSDPGLAHRPLENARRFTARLGRAPAASPIVPVVLGEAARALEAQAMLERAGYLAIAIRPPTVPPGGSRLRFAFSARHQAESIDAVADLLIQHGYA